MTGPVTTTVKSSCSYCGVGCGMVLDVAVDPATVGVGSRRRSGDKEHPTNCGRLCTKGATTADMLPAPRPAGDARSSGPSAGQPPEARADRRTRSRRPRAGCGRHRRARTGRASRSTSPGRCRSRRSTSANKLAKGFIGTNQIESNSRLCMASAGTGYKLSLGADGPPGSYEDFDHADVFFVIGSNMADCHPILFLRMMDRVKAGAKLIVVDPRRTATADKADLFLQIKPGTDLALLNGLLHLLVENGHTDEDFIAEFTEGWEEMPGVPRRLPAATVAEITGIAEADLRTAARWIGEAGELDELLDDGAQPEHARHLEHQRDLQPAPRHRRDLPPRQRTVLAHRPAERDGRPRDGLHGPGPARASAAWSTPTTGRSSRTRGGCPTGTLRTDVGSGTVDMFERMAAGEIKACWIICTNPVASVANRRTVIAGLERASS